MAETTRGSPAGCGEPAQRLAESAERASRAKVYPAQFGCFFSSSEAGSSSLHISDN
jgi:hypothetical protein